MSNSSSVNVTNYHAVSPVYASSDGFDIISSHDVTFNNVFIHSCDDAVSVKGYSTSGYDPEANPALYESVYNINYKNSQLWADDNDGMVMGEESIASSFSNIYFGWDPGKWTPHRRGCSLLQDQVGSSLLSERTRP